MSNTRFNTIASLIGLVFLLHIALGLIFGLAVSWGLLVIFFPTQCWLGVQLARAEHR